MRCRACGQTWTAPSRRSLVQFVEDFHDVIGLPAPVVTHFDWIIVGSGFGGSVCALRLAERGYRVLMLEKGRRFSREDFARTNWELGRWF